MIEVAIRQSLRNLTLEVDFTAPLGVTSIFGPSGAGKTSILRAIAGLSAPEHLHLRIGGEDLSGRSIRDRGVGYVFQDVRLFPHMTVQQNLRYGGRHDEGRVVEMLGLGDLLGRRPGRLSGGEAQRVAIGRALMSKPRMLLLDEPLTGLDAARKAAILPYLERLRDDVRLPILHVSHDLAEVTRLANTLVMLRGGKVVAAGALDDVLADPAATRHLGPRQAGAVIRATVVRHDPDGDLTELGCAAGALLVPGQIGVVGAAIRLRILAHDVILSRDVPQNVSALNVLPVTVTALQDAASGVDVVLQWGDDRLLARITRRSAAAMGLHEGMALHAMVKASAVGAG